MLGQAPKKYEARYYQLHSLISTSMTICALGKQELYNIMMTFG